MPELALGRRKYAGNRAIRGDPFPLVVQQPVGAHIIPACRHEQPVSEEPVGRRLTKTRCTLAVEAGSALVVQAGQALGNVLMPDRTARRVMQCRVPHHVHAADQLIKGFVLPVPRPRGGAGLCLGLGGLQLDGARLVLVDELKRAAHLVEWPVRPLAVAPMPRVREAPRGKQLEERLAASVVLEMRARAG